MKAEVGRGGYIGNGRSKNGTAKKKEVEEHTSKQVKHKRRQLCPIRTKSPNTKKRFIDDRWRWADGGRWGLNG